MKWFSRRHKHQWKNGMTQMSLVTGYDDKTIVQRCTKIGCTKTRTVHQHKCSNCGHIDEKHSFAV